MELSEFQRQSIQSGTSFVTYRLPHTSEPVTLISNESPHILLPGAPLPKTPGFLFAPFEASEVLPVFWLNAGSIITGQEIPDESELKRKKKLKHESSVHGGSDLTTGTLSGAGLSLPNPVPKKIYISQAEKLINACRNETVSKVVLSRPMLIPFNSPIEAPLLFQRLTRKFPDAFVYMLNIPYTGLWIGASPELLLSVHNTGKKNRMIIKTMALAGTRPSHSKPSGHLLSAVPLTDNGLSVSSEPWGTKEITEQEWVVKFVNQQLTDAGCEDISQSERYTALAGNVEHLRTDFTAEISQKKEDTQVIRKLLNALHPTPAVCGWPSEVAKQLINNTENYSRYYYTGYLGPMNMHVKESPVKSGGPSVNASAANSPIASLFVNLRCMQAIGENAALYVGGGITTDSESTREWNETLIKSRTLLAEIEKLQNLAH